MKSLLAALFVMLAAGAGVVFYSAGSDDDAAAAATGDSPLDAEYDYYITDMRATRFGSDGQALTQLLAERVTHYPDERADLEKPDFTSFGVGGDPWQVTASAGTLAPDAQAGERLDLAGDVELRKPYANGNFIDVRTDELSVFLDTEEATSAAPVTVQMRDARLEGVGLHVLLAEDEDYFQVNDGSGSHEPNL